MYSDTSTNVIFSVNSDFVKESVETVNVTNLIWLILVLGRQILLGGAEGFLDSVPSTGTQSPLFLLRPTSEHHEL
jgi:hypothetical protein